jgi:hypothetical protein
VGLNVEGSANAASLPTREHKEQSERNIEELKNLATGLQSPTPAFQRTCSALSMNKKEKYNEVRRRIARKRSTSENMYVLCLLVFW